MGGLLSVCVGFCRVCFLSFLGDWLDRAFLLFVVLIWSRFAQGFSVAVGVAQFDLLFC